MSREGARRVVCSGVDIQPSRQRAVLVRVDISHRFNDRWQRLYPRTATVEAASARESRGRRRPRCNRGGAADIPALRPPLESPKEADNGMLRSRKNHADLRRKVRSRRAAG